MKNHKSKASMMQYSQRRLKKQRSKVQGREEERRILAVKLLKTGLSIEQVSEVTGLNIDLLKKLKSE